MSEIKITARYAQALFMLAVEQHTLEDVEQDMALVSQVCTENREFVHILRSPIVNSSKKHKILKAIFDGKVQTIVYHFLHILIRKNRGAFIEKIAAEFVELYNDYKGIKVVQVASAAPLNEGERTKILSLLRNLTPKEIQLAETIKSSLIGGFLIKLDDYQIDQSLQGKIKQFKRSFEKNLYVKGF